MNAVDTNWLQAMFFSRDPMRTATTARFLRHHQSGPLLVSPIVVIEARNVFSRLSGEAQPQEWSTFEQDGRFYRDPMNWDLFKRDVFDMVLRYGHKEALGTFDLAIVASARLGGATRLLSFDGQVKALAAAEGLEVFPELTTEEKGILSRLRN